MFDKKYICLIQNKFSDFYKTKKLLNSKFIENSFSTNELDELRIYLKTISPFCNMDKNDALKNFIRLILNDIFEISKCLTCLKELSIDYTFNKRKFCSIKCKNLGKDVWLEKSKETCLKKYGTEWSFQSENNKQKSKRTLLEKYGESNLTKIPEIVKKRNETCLKKYGEKTYVKSEDFKNKKLKTVREKYGVDCILDSKDIQDKRKETCLKKYGVKSVLSLKEIQSKIKETMIKRYGVEFCNQIPAAINKSKLKYSLKAFDKIVNKKNYTPLFNKNDITLSGTFNWQCNKCGNIFQSNGINLKNPPRCLKCYPLCNGTSIQETDLIDYIRSIHDNDKIKTHDRTIINPYELDVVITDKKIAFEFNGSFFHSVTNDYRNKDYHLMKTNLCNEAGHKLIHIWEYDWINNKDIIKEKIKAILGVNQTKIYARKCIIKEISSKEKNEFLNQNHIQGEDKSKIKLGLFHENELVAVMTFGKPRFNKKYEYELIRYATKSGYQVLGGAGKLLSHFERSYNPKSIITYADRSYSHGNMYRQIGFRELKSSPPNYYYTDNIVKLSRYECQKHKLKNLLGDKFDQNLSESENMALTRFLKIYDCGNLVFEKIFN